MLAAFVIDLKLPRRMDKLTIVLQIQDFSSDSDHPLRRVLPYGLEANPSEN